MRGHRVARCEVNRQLCHVAINRITINSVFRISCSSPHAPVKPREHTGLLAIIPAFAWSVLILHFQTGINMCNRIQLELQRHYLCSHILLQGYFLEVL